MGVGTLPGPVALRSRTSWSVVVFGNEQHLDRFFLNLHVAHL